MKKKLILLLSIILVMIICLVIGSILYTSYRTNRENKSQERYSEIKGSVMKAVEWNLKVQDPNCLITKEFNEKASFSSHYNSSFLINNGYIKKSELLDIDNKSHCDVYVEIYKYSEDSLSQQHNCNVYYKTYLKCKDYEDKGYIRWS